MGEFGDLKKKKKSSKKKAAFDLEAFEKEVSLDNPLIPMNGC
jgi:translation initiation factor 2 subunit 2